MAALIAGFTDFFEKINKICKNMLNLNMKNSKPVNQF